MMRTWWCFINCTLKHPQENILDKNDIFIKIVKNRAKFRAGPLILNFILMIMILKKKRPINSYLGCRFLLGDGVFTQQ
jgi:hypothetical protein